MHMHMLLLLLLLLLLQLAAIAGSVLSVSKAVESCLTLSHPVMSMHSKKQAVAEASNPLLDAGLLELALSFVGGGHALLIRAVNSDWKACFDMLASANQLGSRKWHHHTSLCTSHQAVFASASTVSLAHDSGFLLNGDHYLQRCAGEYANISTLEAAHKLGLPFSPELMRGAASGRCLAKLQWLHTEQRCPLPNDITEAAARAGDVTMLRWLKESGCEFSEETSAAAARTDNNLPVLKYLHEQGCPWHDRVCESVAWGDDLEQLKWLHAHGAVLDNRAVECAAQKGAVHVFEWLQQQQGIEFTEHTMAYAALNVICSYASGCAHSSVRGAPSHLTSQPVPII
jgi:hypothetical protein